MIFLNLFEEEEVNHLIELLHEASAWRDGIILKVLLAVRKISVSIQLL